MLKMSFSTLYGHYHFKRIPFRLKNVSVTLQRLMNQVLPDLQGVEFFVYLDIVLYTSSLREHEAKLAERLRKTNLKL